MRVFCLLFFMHQLFVNYLRNSKTPFSSNILREDGVHYFRVGFHPAVTFFK